MSAMCVPCAYRVYVRHLAIISDPKRCLAIGCLGFLIKKGIILWPQYIII